MYFCEKRSCKDKLFDCSKRNWSQTIIDKPKLRTYILFKEEYYTENYVKLNLSHSE